LVENVICIEFEIEEMRYRHLMNKTNITLHELHLAFNEWAGEPVDILKLRRDKENEQTPTVMDILFFQPSKEDNLPEEEFFTIIATCGMSTRIMRGPCRFIELILRVQGRQNLEDLRALGRGLGELAVDPFRRGDYFAPNLILCGVGLPIFEGMNCVLITNVGIHSSERLPMIKPSVQLLWVKPIYESEADIIEEIGDIEASRRFTAEGVNWDNPKRIRAHLKNRIVKTNFNEKRAVPNSKKIGKKTVAEANVESVIQNVWKDIENWYKENAPNILDNLRGGASNKQISEIENSFGILLPDDYKASLKIHNGDIYFHSYNYLSLDRVFDKWLKMMELSQVGTFEGNKVEGVEMGIFQNTWWHSNWIPFAEDSGGNTLCIDMAPGINGTQGQILRMEVQSGPSATEHKSFLDWLRGYKDDLYGGRYEVDEFGFIVEKI
jgi:cell wall assembly regulator SMI1